MRKNSMQAQHRGKGRRLTVRNVDNLYGSTEQLRVSLGVINQPEPSLDGQSRDNTFGLEEVLAGFSLIAFAGIVNICY